ncbi:photosystem II cytochrome PsbV2 [Aliterella atlantica]|uniref:Cytochrome C550 n=1 Tax=Aliterella atlantica CENA595 TaxID=1618023 RepID=A0A0D8ZQ80_9CYAN|nr:photosystem II cytochrome PsbV2 [Aliterella atlantica]KJH70659.1 cytochrome C550 [Aliterella atlantica CENA595]
MLRCLLCLVAAVLIIVLPTNPAIAATNDRYLVRFLHVTEPIDLQLDEKGETRSYSPESLLRGKELFEASCLNCHVGGATLPDPQVSLALKKLQGANPPRDNINNLVAFMRQPMVYDGSTETFWCRQVPESWMTQDQIESLAAFVLTAAQRAPGWGTDEF